MKANIYKGDNNESIGELFLVNDGGLSLESQDKDFTTLFNLLLSDGFPIMGGSKGNDGTLYDGFIYYNYKDLVTSSKNHGLIEKFFALYRYKVEFK